MEEMKCDICKKTDNLEIFILRSSRFTNNATKQDAKARRVCFECAKSLFKTGKYRFGYYWFSFFFHYFEVIK